MLLLSVFLAVTLLQQHVFSSSQNVSGHLLPLIDNGHQQMKRWYGVEVPDPPNVPGGWGPWPVICSEPEQLQAIRYCFKDERSARNLQRIVDQAVARWAHAMHPFTAMTISPDNENEKVCGTKVRADALVISDVTKDRDDDHNWNSAETQTTTGYDYRSQTRGRHTLRFGHLIPGAEGTTEGKAVLAMMHELGHAMGLAHEHQRPDAWKYLHYNCENLEGYADALKAATDDWDGKFDALSGGDDSPDEQQMKARIHAFCTDAYFAKGILPSALNFIIGSNMAQFAENDEKWEDFVMSAKFDPLSIMIYNSNSGSSKPDAGKAGWVIWQKDGEKPVYTGGSSDVAQAKISEGDVARVAQMYPLADGRDRDLEMLKTWGKSAVKVMIRGEFEMVVERPGAVASDDVRQVGDPS